MKKATFLFVFILTYNFIVAQDFYLFIKFDEIPGESTHETHKEWCTLESFGQLIEGTFNPRTTEPPIPQGKDVSVIKRIDKSSPKVREILTGRKQIKKVEIEIITRGENPQRIYRYELKNVLVTKHSVLADELNLPMEEITLQFEEQKVTYTWYTRDGRFGGHVITDYK